MGASGGEPRVGEVLADKYRVERVLGRGGMGVVLAATHAALGHQVAIKLLLPTHAPDAEAIARFFREAKVTARLKSAHVAKTLDMGQLADGRPFLVMELLEGRDLGDELGGRDRVPVEQVAAWVLQACEGLAEAHAAGIIHRDLKPANLFLAPDHGGEDVVKILDFGISKLVAETDGHLTSTEAAFGSPTYMSPEQMRSTKGTDARSDIWSIGVILYEALTGTLPFAGETVFAIAHRVMNVEAEPVSRLRADVPPALEALVMRCLAKDPARRPPTVADLADALAPFAGLDGPQRAARVRRALAKGTGAAGHPSLPPPSDGDVTVSLAPTEPVVPPAEESDRWAASRTKPELTPTKKPTQSSALFALGVLTAVATAGAAAWVFRGSLPALSEPPAAAAPLPPVAPSAEPASATSPRAANDPPPSVVDAGHASSSPSPVVTHAAVAPPRRAVPKAPAPTPSAVPSTPPARAPATGGGPFIDERTN